MKIDSALSDYLTAIDRFASTVAEALQVTPQASYAELKPIAAKVHAAYKELCRALPVALMKFIKSADAEFGSFLSEVTPYVGVAEDLEEQTWLAIGGRLKQVSDLFEQAIGDEEPSRHEAGEQPAVDSEAARDLSADLEFARNAIVVAGKLVGGLVDGWRSTLDIALYRATNLPSLTRFRRHRIVTGVLPVVAFVGLAITLLGVIPGWGIAMALAGCAWFFVDRRYINVSELRALQTEGQLALEARAEADRLRQELARLRSTATAMGMLRTLWPDSVRACLDGFQRGDPPAAAEVHGANAELSVSIEVLNGLA